MWTDDDISYAEAMQGWYYAALEAAGVKSADESQGENGGVFLNDDGVLCRQDNQ